MKRIILLLLLTVTAFAQTQKDTEYGVISTSGASLTLVDAKGSGTITLSYSIVGSPSAMSIVAKGCQQDGTCSTLNTSTATSSNLVTFTGGYDHYVITATWTGTSGVTVYKTGIQAKLGTGSSGAISTCATANAVAYYAATGTTVSCNPLLTATATSLAFQPTGVTSGTAAALHIVDNEPSQSNPVLFDMEYPNAQTNTNINAFFGLNQSSQNSVQSIFHVANTSDPANRFTQELYAVSNAFTMWGSGNFSIGSITDCGALFCLTGPTISTSTFVGTNIKAGENVVTSATAALSAAVQNNLVNLVSAASYSFTLVAGVAGQGMTLNFCQPATGTAATVAAPANVRGLGTVGTTLGKCNSQHVIYSANQTAWLADSTMVTNE